MKSPFLLTFASSDSFHLQFLLSFQRRKTYAIYNLAPTSSLSFLSPSLCAWICLFLFGGKIQFLRLKQLICVSVITPFSREEDKIGVFFSIQQIGKVE